MPSVNAQVFAADRVSRAEPTETATAAAAAPTTTTVMTLVFFTIPPPQHGSEWQQ